MNILDNNRKLVQRVLPIVSLALVTYVFAPASMPEPARRMAFIFVVAALLWAFEVVPLYATSILVVLLEIFILGRPDGVLGMDTTGYKVFLQPLGSPIIILFFGGFILAAALHKYELDRIIATHLLKLFGDKPFFVMLGFMLTTAFLSMWMSDTATTAMMIAMVIPLLNQLDREDPFRTGLILSIPFSALIGGMGTPVGTPPNAIAIGLLADQGIHIHFISWMKMAVPLSIVLLCFASSMLFILFPPKADKLAFKIDGDKTLDNKKRVTIGIAVMTIGLWLTSGIHGIPSSAVALLAAGLFTLTGLLGRKELNNISWDVLILMWGGLSLGKGMDISGLAKWIIDLPIFDQQGVVLVVVFCLLAVILSTFMSNTATANLLIPLAMVTATQNSVVLTVMIALCCSLAMALPVSTPPNAIAFSTDMLKSRDMVKAGVVISAVSLVIILMGYKIFVIKALGLG